MKVFAALQRFGAPLLDLTLEDLAHPEVVFQIGQPPVRVDILTSISGVTFDEAWQTRVVSRVSGLELPFIGRACLVKNKRATGRPKDLLDADALEKA